MERLQDIVTTSIIKNGWPVDTSSDCREKDPQVQQCTGYQKTGEERGRPKKTRQSTFKEVLSRDGC